MILFVQVWLKSLLLRLKKKAVIKVNKRGLYDLLFILVCCFSRSCRNNWFDTKYALVKKTPAQAVGYVMGTLLREGIFIWFLVIVYPVLKFIN